MRQPVRDRRNAARSSSAQHRRPHWRPCRQQLGRPRDVPHHLLNHTIRFRGVRCDGCPAYRTRVRSLGCSDEAVPVHDVPTWLRPWVSTKPADGLCVRVAEVTTAHWANVIMSVQGGPVESHLPPHPIDLNAQRWRGRVDDVREAAITGSSRPGRSSRSGSRGRGCSKRGHSVSQSRVTRRRCGCVTRHTMLILSKILLEARS
jgi:hypothetical protein